MYMLDSDQEPSYNLSKDTEVDGRYGKWFNPPVIYNDTQRLFDKLYGGSWSESSIYIAKIT